MDKNLKLVFSITKNNAIESFHKVVTAVVFVI